MRRIIAGLLASAVLLGGAVVTSAPAGSAPPDNYNDYMQSEAFQVSGSYQPLVRKTDLGPKGTWYRLQVGPLADKDAAYRLCGQLKAKGHGDCLVMAQ